MNNSTPNQNDVLEYLEKRFGMHRPIFEGFTFYLASRGRVFIGPQKVPQLPNIASVGLIAGRISKSIKPSSNLLQIFGKFVTKNFIELDKNKTLEFLKGNDLILTPSEIGNTTDGYVLLKYLNYPIGCGLLKGKKDLKNMLPKAKRLKISNL